MDTSKKSAIKEGERADYISAGYLLFCSLDTAGRHEFFVSMTLPPSACHLKNILLRRNTECSIDSKGDHLYRQ